MVSRMFDPEAMVTAADLGALRYESGIEVGGDSGTFTDAEVAYALAAYHAPEGETDLDRRKRLQLVAAYLCEALIARLVESDSRIPVLRRRAQFLRTEATSGPTLPTVVIHEGDGMVGVDQAARAAAAAAQAAAHAAQGQADAAAQAAANAARAAAAAQQAADARQRALPELADREGWIGPRAAPTRLATFDELESHENEPHGGGGDSEGGRITEIDVSANPDTLILPADYDTYNFLYVDIIQQNEHRERTISVLKLSQTAAGRYRVGGSTDVVWDRATRGLRKTEGRWEQAEIWSVSGAAGFQSHRFAIADGAQQLALPENYTDFDFLYLELDKEGAGTEQYQRTVRVTHLAENSRLQLEIGGNNALAWVRSRRLLAGGRDLVYAELYTIGGGGDEAAAVGQDQEARRLAVAAQGTADGAQSEAEANAAAIRAHAASTHNTDGDARIAAATAESRATDALNDLQAHERTAHNTDADARAAAMQADADAAAADAKAVAAQGAIAQHVNNHPRSTLTLLQQLGLLHLRLVPDSVGVPADRAGKVREINENQFRLLVDNPYVITDDVWFEVRLGATPGARARGAWASNLVDMALAIPQAGLVNDIENLGGKKWIDFEVVFYNQAAGGNRLATLRLPVALVDQA